MKKPIWAAGVVALLAVACGRGTATTSDQCVRREVMLECLAALPAPPVGATYSDWSEVVGQCSSHANYASYRTGPVPPECAWNGRVP